MWTWFKKKSPASAIRPSERKTRHYNAQSVRQRQGHKAEAIALAYLTEQGLKHIDSNVAYAQGELDLIMWDKQVLVFVEVRWRKSMAFGGALASITPAKLQRIQTAIALFLQQRPEWRDRDYRIDVVTLQGELTQPLLDWLPNVTG